MSPDEQQAAEDDAEDYYDDPMYERDDQEKAV